MPKLSFVPIGDFPVAAMQELITFYKNTRGLTITIRPAITRLPSTALDRTRHQLIAEELLRAIRKRFPDATQDPRANHPAPILIGLTKGDIYTRAETWQYAFSSQQDNVAIVSTARLDPTHYGQPADPERLQSRLRKMVSKRIGMMLYRLPPSQDRNSVLYSPILSVADLDQVGEKF